MIFRNGNELRVYLNGNRHMSYCGTHYASISATSCDGHGKCMESTMTKWGKEISLEEAMKLVPDYHEKCDLAKMQIDKHIEEENASSYNLMEAAVKYSTDEALIAELSNRGFKIIKEN